MTLEALAFEQARTSRLLIMWPMNPWPCLGEASFILWRGEERMHAWWDTWRLT